LCKPIHKERVNEVWLLWKEIIEFVEGKRSPTKEFQQKLDTFGNQVLNLFEWKIMTPYLHILVHHTCSIMTKFKSIPQFSQEGFEAANKLQKKIALRATDHTTQKSVRQQFFHFYRMVYLNKNL